MLRHVPSHSSNIKSIGYNPERRELHVTFNHGGEYAYQDVDQEHFDTLKGHNSPGSYIHEQFVKPKHPFRKV